MPEVAPGLRRYIAAALTGAGSAGAEVGVSVLLDKDPQVAAAAATAIIGRIPTLPADRRAALAEELVALASDKKHRLPPAAELPVVRVLASLNDPAAADALWDRVLPPHPPEVRAAALQAVGGWVQAPTKDQWRRLFACAAEPDFRVAAPALMVLGRLPPDKQLDEWVELLHAPDVAARRLAMEKVGDRDTAEVAAGLMAQLAHPDRGLRDAARNRLAKLDHGRKALAAAVLRPPTPTSCGSWPGRSGRSSAPSPRSSAASSSPTPASTWTPTTTGPTRCCSCSARPTPPACATGCTSRAWPAQEEGLRDGPEVPETAGPRPGGRVPGAAGAGPVRAEEVRQGRGRGVAGKRPEPAAVRARPGAGRRRGPEGGREGEVAGRGGSVLPRVPLRRAVRQGEGIRGGGAEAGGEGLAAFEGGRRGEEQVEVGGGGYRSSRQRLRPCIARTGRLHSR